MKSSTEIFTALTKDLQDLNQEIRQKLSSMPSYTELEMQRLGQWLKQVSQEVNNCENSFLIVSHHLNLLSNEYNETVKRDSSRG